MNFGILKIQSNINTLNTKDFLTSGVSPYNFSTLNTQFLHNLIDEKLSELIEQDQTLLWTCVAGAHLQCVNNHYTKFE